MARIGIDAQITRAKGNIIECTLTIYATRMMNGMKKIKGIDNPTKRAGPSVQGMVKTQPEIVEVKIDSLYPHRCSLHCALMVECPKHT